MPNIVTVATANTYGGEMLQDPSGLDPFLEHQVDILLMQEVLGMTRIDVAARLGHDCFRLVAHDDSTGLAIAVNEASSLNPKPETARTDIFLPKSKDTLIAQALPLPAARRMRDRGMLAVKLEAEGGAELIAATTHPIVFMRWRARNRQVRGMGQALENAYFDAETPLVLGADMNHYPGPRKTDQEVATAAGLARVEVTQPSWLIGGSKHEWLARLIAKPTRRSLDDFNAQLDSMLYRELVPLQTKVVEITSDHRAIIGRFWMDDAQSKLSQSA